MSVAIVTPFVDEPPAWLQQCLSSVAHQTMACTHFLVADGGAPSGVEIPDNVQLIRLPRPHRDYGNVARAIGSVSAIGQGFDAIAWLDADNWYECMHIERLWRTHERTGAAICTTGRALYSLAGDFLGQCPEVDGSAFVDTNCFLLCRQAFGLVSAWYQMPADQSCVGDRVFWKAVLDSKLPRAHVAETSLCYRTAFASHYRLFGKEPPPQAKANIVPPASFVTAAAAGQPKIVPSSRKQSVSLCMIVKNEEGNLEECLATVCDLVDEIIVVDTGSTDRTRQIAQRHRATVVDFAWVDSFAAARNEALKHATGDWIFWMDADDRLDATNRDRFQRLRQQLPDGNYAYMMKQWSSPDHPLGSPLVVDHVRLFRRQPNVGWRYRLHEQILSSLKEANAKIVVTDMVVEHVGYRQSDLRRQKLERNLRILLLEHEEQPEDAFVLFNLAGTYLDMGDADKGVPFLHQCVEAAPRGASFLPKAYVLIVQDHRTANRLDEALHSCQKALGLFPRNPELLFEEGLIHQARKDPIKAQQSFEAILRLPRGPQFVGTDEGIFGHLTRHHLALTLRDQRQLLAAEDQWRLVTEQAPHYAPGWLALMEVLLDQKRFPSAEALVDHSRTLPQAPVIHPVLVARLHLARKELDAAVTTLEHALITAPDNHWLRLFLCDVMNRHGIARDRVEQHLNEILSLDRGNRQAKAKLAELLKRKTEAAPPA